MEPSEEQPVRPRGRRLAVLVVVAVLLLTADIVTKLAVVAHVRPGERIHLLGDALFITLVRNSGAAFSVGQGATLVFSLVAIIVIVVIVRVARRLRSRAWAVALGLVFGGATGNLVDRVFRGPGFLHGAVVDWIGTVGGHFPVFNLADSGIVVGGALAVLLSWIGLRVDATVDGRDREPPVHQPVDGNGPSGAAR